jgi:hypothetical protein
MTFVIQCPQCRSEFAVEKQLLDSNSPIFFHCSRCDNVFEKPVYIRDLKDHLSLSSEAKLNIAGNESNFEISSEQLRTAVPASQKETPPSVTSLTKNTLHQEKERTPKGGGSKLHARHENNIKTASRETPQKKRSQTQALGMFKDSLQETLDRTLDTLKVFKKLPNFIGLPQQNKRIKSRPAQDTKEGSSLDQKTGSERTPHEVAFTDHTITNQKEEVSSLTDLHTDPIKESSILQKGSDLDQNRIQISRASGTHPQSWSGFMLLVAPILLFLSCIALVSIYSTNAPVATERVLSFLSTPHLSPPPPGLSIIETQFRKLSLEDGAVYLITGTLFNDSDQSFKDITVQGFVYDAMGNSILTSFSSLTSALSELDLKTLDDQIKKSSKYIHNIALQSSGMHSVTSDKKATKANEDTSQNRDGEAPAELLLTKNSVLSLAQTVRKNAPSIQPKQKFNIVILLNNKPNVPEALIKIENELQRSKYFGARIYSVK